MLIARSSNILVAVVAVESVEAVVAVVAVEAVESGVVVVVVAMHQHMPTEQLIKSPESISWHSFLVIPSLVQLIKKVKEQQFYGSTDVN